MPDGPTPMTAIFSANGMLRWLSICMALADSVPGVSDGTIAFLMGFYDVFVGSALAVTVLAGAFTDGIYQLSSLFLGFVLVFIPLVMREQRAVLGAFREN